MKTNKLQYKFVENIPDDLQEGILYISLPYCIVIHRCVCGCGNEVSTPISPIGWELIFDGETVSLYPSIGNWSYECQSHYFITKSEVNLMPRWTKKEIRKGRQVDSSERKLFEKKKKRKSWFKK